MIISEGLAQKIKSIANKMIDGKSRNVLLVRRFENANDTVIPRDFGQLKDSLMNNKTFEFHHKFYFGGHKIENLDHWINVTGKSSQIESWPIPYM